MKKVHLKHISILRKSVIVNWLQQHDLRTVQYMSGHKHISSTENYTTTNIEQLKTSVVQLHPF